MDGSVDLANSFVIGDRITDVQLAKKPRRKGRLDGDGILNWVPTKSAMMRGICSKWWP